MGGDAFTPLTLSNTPEEGSSDGYDFADAPFSSEFPELHRDDLRVKVEDVTLGENDFGKSGQVGPPFSTSLELQGDRRRQKVYAEVYQSYEQLQLRGGTLNEAKSKILSYVPGAWIESVCGLKRVDYDVPETTTLLLIGPKGSGKSSLINRISRLFEEDKFGPDRAQVSYAHWTANSSSGNGTCFLQEYMIPRSSTSFCLYDSRSLSDKAQNIDTIKHWMTKGVCHGELVTRQSDSSSFRRIMEQKCQRKSCQSGVVRMVNFVILVVNGVTVLKSMEVGDSEETKYMEMITTTFSCPYLSFRDDKPVVVVTHGDLLSLADRIRVRVYLGELLGIPPAKQIFDIPDNCDPATELTIVDMLRYSLKHADHNFPCKYLSLHKVHRSSRASCIRLSRESCIYLLLVLWIVVISIFIHQDVDKRRAKNSELHIDWHAIRHLWLGLNQ